MSFLLSEKPIPAVTGPLPDAEPVNTGEVHGPIAIPYTPWGWDTRRDGPPPADKQPHHPGLYGRYLPIDLDENNRHQIAERQRRHPDRQFPELGWGVVRHGFGLQNFGDGHMTRAVAEQRACALNQGRPVTDTPNQ